MNRRKFVRNGLIATAGVALVGRSALAICDPAPINAGPAPRWVNFQYVIKNWEHYSRRPKLDPLDQPGPYESLPPFHGTAGWKGSFEGKQYGSYVVVSDGGLFNDQAFISDIKQLLKEQADETRHALIKQADYPCFCRMCKTRELIAMDQGNGAYVSGRAVSSKNEQDFIRAFMAIAGPTNGYA